MKAPAVLACLLLLACTHKVHRVAAVGGHGLDGWASGDAPGAPDTSLPEDESETEVAYHPPTLYFAYDSRELRETELPKLVEMGRRLKGHCTVNGYASPEGTDDYNFALGHKRAQAVTEYLRLLNCKASLNAMSYGEENIVSNGDPDLFWLDRRVEVRCL